MSNAGHKKVVIIQFIMKPDIYFRHIIPVAGFGEDQKDILKKGI